MDTSPTALFESYETDFLQFINTIKERLDNGAQDTGEQRKSSLRRVEMELEEADEMVSQMELEMQGIAQNIRPSYSTRLVSAKAELSRFKKALAEARSQLARADLIGAAGRPASTYPSSDDPYSDRARLLVGTSVLEQGTKRLQESQRLAIETEMQGADILNNLRSQREQIENSRSTLDRADLAIDRASSTLKQMVRRMYQQRAVTYAIIVVLLLLIGVIIWEKASG